MREKKFTPGPWEFEGTPEFFPLIFGEQGDLIGQCFHSDDDGEDNITTEQCGANTSLIAAAPELLEALEEMVKMYKDIEPSGGYQGVYENATYAIAKAYGETK